MLEGRPPFAVEPLRYDNITDFQRLRKEWFLLLVREVFDPEHGMLRFLLACEQG